MKTAIFISFVGILTFCSDVINGEVCMFYNLHADCYYRVDAICLSHIIGEINQCADPIEVTFHITCNRPHVDFRHTFSSSDQQVAVPGFDMPVDLHVKLTMKEGDTLNVEADFFVSGLEKTDFVNSDVKLRGLSDSCPLLNRAAQIAIGTMGGLAVVAAILILGLLYVRCRRRTKAAQNSNELIRNVENPALSTPRASRTEETLDQMVPSGHVTPSNTFENGHMTAINRSENGHMAESGQMAAINRSEDVRVSTENGSERQQIPYRNDYSANSNTQNGCDLGTNGQITHGEHNDAVRYSDIIKNSTGNQFKISDC